MSKAKTVQAVAELESVIHELRGHRVMLDSDLARAYGVETRALVQAVKRNPERFPADFAFQLTNQEVARLRSQSVMLKVGGRKPGGRRFGIPWAFTEHGAVMAANLLRSPAAIDKRIHVARAFVRTRRTLAAQAELDLAAGA